MPTNFILDKNLVFSRMTPTREKVFETIKKIFEFEKEIRYESINPFNALQDCQIIVPLNEKSELARKALNPLLQDYFTPSPKQKTKSKSLETLKMHGINILDVSKVLQFRRGDKIIDNLVTVLSLWKTGNQEKIVNNVTNIDAIIEQMNEVAELDCQLCLTFIVILYPTLTTLTLNPKKELLL